LFSGHNRKKKQIRLGDAIEQLELSLLDSVGGESKGLGGYNSPKSGGGGAEGGKLKLHNAGNDACATLALFWKLMEMKE
jgi:hypothetical protein